MIRSLATLLLSLTLAFGWSARAVSVLCGPSEEGCCETCCCGDESACPCIDSAPDVPKQPPAPVRVGEDTRPVLLPPEPVTQAIAPRPSPVVAAAAPVSVRPMGGVRSQALLCRWRT